VLIPKFWAEGVARSRQGRRRWVVRRWGWSDESLQQAEAMANERASAAMERRLRGQSVNQREPKVPYGAGDGVPIREEVVERAGDCVITRNAYGARCLNVEHLFIADLDFASPRRPRSWAWLWLGAGAASLALGHRWGWALLGVAALLLVRRRLSATRWEKEPEVAARQQVNHFLEHHPHWRLRLYRTPAGFRLIAEHARFTPDSEDTQRWFQRLGTDPAYARLCQLQRCFRARLTAKPWRLGIRERLRPRPGVWPLDSEEKLARRREWVARYERQARQYAACRYLETLGSGVALGELRQAIELHDRLSQARSSLPLA